MTTKLVGDIKKKERLKSKKKRTVSQKAWLERQLNDPYVIKSKQMGYRSRAAFKLLDINDKFKFLKKGQVVVDLGAAPGGWSQIVASKIDVQNSGKLIAIDLQEIDPLEGVHFLQMDFLSEEAFEKLCELLPEKADVILSDMAPAACGMPKVDHLRIMALIEAAWDFAVRYLKPGGCFVAKSLRGGSEQILLNDLKKHFKKVVHFKPPSSRKDSAEIFVVAMDFTPSDNL